MTGANPDNEYMTLPHEFNSKFDVRRLALVSLSDFCKTESFEEVNTIQTQRQQSIKETHTELIERLKHKNFMNIYRLADYEALSEIDMDFIIFISNKMQ